MCYSPTQGISGRLFEETTLGVCGATCCGHMSRREAMEQVRKHQPATKRPAVVRLEAEVSRQLGQAVVFFTAVGSALDKFHSVDGFFQLGSKVVTVDVTVNDNKYSGKADLIIRADDFEDLVALARQIARFYAPKPERSCPPRQNIRVWRAA